MLKRLALIVGAAVGITMLRKKARQQQAEQELWNQATDDVQAPPATTAPGMPAAPPAPSQDTPPAQS